MNWKRLGLTACKAVCLSALLAGIVWNVRLGVADWLARRNQPDSTRLAMRWMPSNGAYSAQLADEIYASDPGSAQLLLQQALNQNRYDASSWIQLGLLREASNEPTLAEQALERAAAADTTFLPSWSLANFYFRRNDTAKFWYWASRAAQMSPGDATALLRLAWYVSPSVPEVEERLHLNRPMLESQFVSFLMTQGEAEAVKEAALPLLAEGNESSTASLLGACDWLIGHGRPELALPLCKGLAASHRAPYAALAADSSDAVTNGGFVQSPTSRGFDWRLTTVAGVSSFLNSRPNALGFEFSGDEPDSFLIMSQVAPVQARSDYALIVDYETKGIPPGSGLAWTVTDVRSGAILGRSPSLSADEGGKAYACFAAPPGSGFVDLSLRYQRQPGTVRVEGKLALQRVRLTAATGAECPEKKMSASETAFP
jgi:hypothetical protein